MGPAALGGRPASPLAPLAPPPCSAQVSASRYSGFQDKAEDGGEPEVGTRPPLLQLLPQPDGLLEIAAQVLLPGVQPLRLREEPKYVPTDDPDLFP